MKIITMTLLKLDKNQQKERENVNTTDLALTWEFYIDFTFYIDVSEGDVLVLMQVIGNERRYSRDSDSDEDVPDELRADFVDERTGDAPSPQRK